MRKSIQTLLAFAVLAFYAFPVHAVEPQQQLPTDFITVRTASGQEYSYEVEMALTGGQQSSGLMGRTHMEDHEGMLFVFGDNGSRTFWMKDTLIPLDMIFIAHDGTINHIHHSAKPQDTSKITSDRPAMAVLEINGGLAGMLGIKEGDKVIHDIFRNNLAP